MLPTSIRPVLMPMRTRRPARPSPAGSFACHHHLLNRKGCRTGVARMLGILDRCPPECHHGVADELIDGAAMGDHG
jgi:hypothetical protein